jgi:hypothetical protein
MKPVLFLILFLCSLQTIAQFNNSRFAIPYSDKCPRLLYCTDSLSSPALFKKNLTKYFSKEINWRKLEPVKGVIVVQISIDSNGVACCKGYVNYTINRNEEVADIWIDRLINAMPQWRPAICKGKPVNTMRAVALYCHVAGHADFEVNYYYGMHSKINIDNVDNGDMRILDGDEIKRPVK